MIEFIEFLKNLTVRSGVYRMIDAKGKILYVGKAKNLKKRVASYFRDKGLTSKTLSMISKTVDIQITVTQTETEALLLEQNLIKDNRPPYNILLKDDKSYPYIFINTEHEFPGIFFNRGKKYRNGKIFGPFPSVASVKGTLNNLQKAFQLRQCTDSFFACRSRPCIQYQIGRCSAPCVGLIPKSEYREDLDNANYLLLGNSDELIKTLQGKMDKASSELRFEQALKYRNTISQLRSIQTNQVIDKGFNNLDAISVAYRGGSGFAGVLRLRNGKVLGVDNFLLQMGMAESSEEATQAFIMQHYLEKTWDIPPKILISKYSNQSLSIAGLLGKNLEKKIQIVKAKSKDELSYLEIASTNAEEKLEHHLNSRLGYKKRMNSLVSLLNLPKLPRHIECFDISHTSGEATIGSCVVFNEKGASKQDYRIFKILDVKKGDDYEAMRQVLKRRFKNASSGDFKRPDLVIVDGGRGQCNIAIEVFKTFEIKGVEVIGISKGSSRKAGFEILHDGKNGDEIIPPLASPALHLIQQIRDEAHRFAITRHRQARQKARVSSSLENLPGIGPARRQALLRHFGGIQGLLKANLIEISKVKGISQDMAETVYASFHKDI